VDPSDLPRPVVALSITTLDWNSPSRPRRRPLSTFPSTTPTGSGPLHVVLVAVDGVVSPPPATPHTAMEADATSAAGRTAARQSLGPTHCGEDGPGLAPPRFRAALLLPALVATPPLGYHGDVPDPLLLRPFVFPVSDRVRVSIARRLARQRHWPRQHWLHLLRLCCMIGFALTSSSTTTSTASPSSSMAPSFCATINPTPPGVPQAFPCVVLRLRLVRSVFFGVLDNYPTHGTSTTAQRLCTRLSRHYRHKGLSSAWTTLVASFIPMF
jgi:hypothetical protein